MSRTYDVLIERQNGHFRAIVPGLPGVVAEAASRDEALDLVWRQAESLLKTIEVATIDLDAPAEHLRPGSPQAVLQAIAACKLDVQSEFYQEYLANLAEEKRRQREEAAAEFETSTMRQP